jgi:Tol biopolymer transport system component
MSWRARTTVWVAALAATACAPGEQAGEEAPDTSAVVAGAPRDAVLDAAWSRDGRRIAVAWYRGSRSRLYGLFGPARDGSLPAPSRGLPVTAGQGTHPTWSPDGLWVAFATSRDGNSEVYRVRPDGTGPENLTTNPSNDGEPAFSPNGKLIAFTTDRDGEGPRLYVMGADGSDPRAVGDSLPGKEQHDPTWSPDGHAIAFATTEGVRTSIHVVTLADGGERGLGEGEEPTWAADGRVYYSLRDSVFARTLDGNPPHLVVPDARAPTASPDGRWLAFVRGPDATAGLYLLDLGSGVVTRITR